MFNIFKRKEKQVVKPAFPGQVYDIYDQLLTVPHLLIAGSTGSGKSVLMNALVYTALHYGQDEKQFIFIDHKKVEMIAYKNLQHTIGYSNNMLDTIRLLKQACNIMENRLEYMVKNRLKTYPGTHIYIFFDEYADMIYTDNREDKKQVEKLVSRLAALARSCRIHLIIGTQRPTRDIVTGMLKTNIPDRIGLRCPTKQDSRNIINFAGCETLPRYGYGYFLTTTQTQPILYKFPMISETDIGKAITWYSK